MTRLALVGLIVVAASFDVPVDARPGPPLVCHQLDIGTAGSLPWKDGPFGMDPGFPIQRVAAETERILAASDDAVVHMETLRRAYIYLGIGSDEPGLLALGALLKERIIDSETTENVGVERARQDALAWFDLGYLMAIIENNGGPILTPRSSSRRILERAPSPRMFWPDIHFGVGYALTGNHQPGPVATSRRRPA